MITLLFFVDIGDEDGPSFSYIIQKKIPPSSIVVLSNDIDRNLLNFGEDKWYNSDQLDEIFNTYKIDYIYEIHDWYDFINKDEAKKIEISLLAKHKLPKKKNIQYDLVTYNKYVCDVEKYMIPVNQKATYNEKVKPPQKYLVKGLYADIFSEYDIINHHIFILDCCGECNEDCDEDCDE